jgi:hypothetical protein
VTEYVLSETVNAPSERVHRQALLPASCAFAKLPSA